MTIKAVKIAYDAHLGQLDYNGVPYIFHPYHLAEQMDDEISCTVALLHDVVEDTSLTFSDLEQIFPKQVVEIVMLLTHDEKVDYFDYIQKIKTNAIATKIPTPSATTLANCIPSTFSINSAACALNT